MDQLSLRQFKRWSQEIKIHRFHQRPIGSTNVQLLRSIDAGNQAVRFGPLHVRLQEGLAVSQTVVHFDNFDIVTSPIRHGGEWLYQGFKYNNW